MPADAQAELDLDAARRKRLKIASSKHKLKRIVFRLVAGKTGEKRFR
jgi:hypothetical protein